MKQKEIEEYIKSVDDSYSFVAFKSWLKRNHKMNTTSLDNEKEIDLFLEEYEEARMKGDFEAVHGVKYSSFKGWIEWEGTRRLADVRKDKEQLNEALKEYKSMQMMHIMSKRTMYNTIMKLMYDEPLEENEWHIYNFIREQEEG